MFRVAVTLMTVNTKVSTMVQRKTITVSDDVVSCCSPLSGTTLSEGEANDLSQIFSALSDPARLRMLSLIASDVEVCSCALEEPLNKSQPTVSHHTRILAEAGLIVGEKRGRWMWWRVVPERLNDVARILTD
jgi:ArsR family transcriptional regulator, arsenate/arsenite/antimonite-responsive transcriptional repressor